MTQTTAPTYLPASDLKPGTIVLKADGTRWFAAFDVDVQHTDQGEALTVTVWTAVRDQDAGIPDVLEFTADTRLVAGTPVEPAAAPALELSSDAVTTVLRAGGILGTSTTVQHDGVVAVVLSRPVARYGAAVLLQAGYAVTRSGSSVLYVATDEDTL